VCVISKGLAKVEPTILDPNLYKESKKIKATTSSFINGDLLLAYLQNICYIEARIGKGRFLNSK
jgi:hypothetical protein